MLIRTVEGEEINLSKVGIFFNNNRKEYDIMSDYSINPKYVFDDYPSAYKDVYDFYKDYDLSNINIIKGDKAKTEGNNIYITNDEDLVRELWHYLSQNPIHR